MDCFTYQWTNECRENMLCDEGKPLTVSVGGNFLKRGVGKGDLIYVVATWQGPVFLIGRMKVKKVWQRRDWDAQHDTPDLWPGDEVIEGELGTPMHFESPIPPDVLRKMRFIDGSNNEKRLAMTDGVLDDPQSIRSVRKLTRDSAALLDDLLSV